MARIDYPFKLTVNREPGGPAEAKTIGSREALLAEVTRTEAMDAAAAEALVERILDGDTVTVTSGDADLTLHADRDPHSAERRAAN